MLGHCYINYNHKILPLSHFCTSVIFYLITLWIFICLFFCSSCLSVALFLSVALYPPSSLSLSLSLSLSFSLHLSISLTLCLSPYLSSLHYKRTLIGFGEPFFSIMSIIFVNYSHHFWSLKRRIWFFIFFIMRKLCGIFKAFTVCYFHWSNADF